MATMRGQSASTGDVDIELPNPNGRAAATGSRPTVWSNEDLAAIGPTTEAAAASDTATAGLNGLVKRLLQRLTVFMGQLPASLGAKVSVSSLSVTTATDSAELALLGAVNETAPSSDTASSGGNGRLQRIAQRITSVLGSLGVPSDLAWTSGDATHTALLKAIATQAISPVPPFVVTPIQLVDVTLSTDTNAYASGDLIADTQIVNSAVRATDALGVLQSLVLIDEADQKAALDIYFLSANNTFGTENSAPSILDANAGAILAVISVASGDYKDLGGVSVVEKANLSKIIKPATGSDDIYVAVVNGSGTPTYGATSLKLRVGVVC